MTVASFQASEPTSLAELHDIVRRAGWRLVPFLSFLYFISFLDRVNIGFAALEMNADLSLSAYAYGLGGGLFFIGYLLFQVPSNYMLQRVGAKRWLSVIMLAWGLASFGMGFVRTPTQFYVARLILGMAEAGFFPGLVLYITHWFPARQRSRIMAGLLLSIPIATIVGAPLSGLILSHFAGHPDFAAWRWLFVIEASPAILCALLVRLVLPDGPAAVSWLSTDEKRVLGDAIAADQAAARPTAQGGMAAILQGGVIRYSLAYFGIGLGLYGVGLWLPQIIKASGVTNESAVLLTAIPYIAAAITMVVWGRIADARPGLPASNCWIPALVAAVALGSVAIVPGLGPQLALLSVAAAGILGAVVTFWTLPTAAIPPANMAVAVAVINTTGSIGGFVGPFVVGWLSDVTHGFGAGLLVLASGALGAALILILAPRVDAGVRA